MKFLNKIYFFCLSTYLSNVDFGELCLTVHRTVKRQRSKVQSKAIKVRTRPKFSNFTAMDDARTWSELLSAIISHFGMSILWHIGMSRQYDEQ